MTLDDLRSRLSKAHERVWNGKSAISGCCPAHDDRSPSFFAWVSPDGWLQLHCPVCSREQVMAALGITEADRRPVGWRKAEGETQYIYRDADEQPLLRKTRSTYQGKKTFRLEEWADGEWHNGLRKLGDRRYTLYRLSEVLRAKDTGQTVYLNEGEKACDAMAARGLLGTCQPFGADAKPSKKWNQQHTLLLKDANVVVVADRDEVGEGYARHVAEQLLGRARSVRIVQSKTDAPKDDAFDHLKAGFGEDDWVDRADLLPPRGLSTRKFQKTGFEAVQLEFLVEPQLPRGKCVLFDADGGTGKTSMCIALAASLSNAYDPVNGRQLERRMRTLYLHKGEDQDDELMTVYSANHGDFDGIEFYADDLCLDDAGVRRVEETVTDGHFDLVVFDAFFYFLQGVVQDTSVALDAMRVMDRLNRMAGRTGCTVVNIRHTTKGTVGRRASELGMGSVQFRNSHRGQLVARWHPTNAGLVVVTDEKGSLLVPRGPHFCYRRVGDHEIQLVRGVDNPFEDAATGVTKLDLAKRLLLDLVSTQYVPATRCYAEAKRLEISARTLETAKRDLDVRSTHKGFTDWQWTLLPETGVEEVDPFA